MMIRILLVALMALASLSTLAWADSPRSGRRLDAIQSGRFYDPVLTPQMNPNFEFDDPNAEARFMLDLRKGRIDINQLPEAQREYFRFKLENGG